MTSNDSVGKIVSAITLAFSIGLITFAALNEVWTTCVFGVIFAVISLVNLFAR